MAQPLQSVRILLLGTKSGIERFNPQLYKQKSLTTTVKDKRFYFEAVAEDDLRSLDFLPQYEQFDCICMCYEYVDQERILIFNEGGRFGNFWKNAKLKLGKQVKNYDFRVILVTRQCSISNPAVEGAVSYQDELTTFEENHKLHQWTSNDRVDFENSSYNLFKNVTPRIREPFYKSWLLLPKTIPLHYIIGTLIIIIALMSLWIPNTLKPTDEQLPHLDQFDSQHNISQLSMNTTTNNITEIVQIREAEKQHQFDFQFCDTIIKKIFDNSTDYCSKIATLQEDGNTFVNKTFTEDLKNLCVERRKLPPLNRLTQTVKGLVDERCKEVEAKIKPT